MTRNLARRFLPKRLLRSERGAVAIALTIYLPFFVGLTTLAVDASYVLWTRNQLQATAEAAALAATYKLPDNSACTIADGTAPNPSVQYPGSCDMAKVYAEKNMPLARYGTVLLSADVVVGKWTPGCLGGGASNESCFAPVPPATSCVTFGCNGVKVTTRKAASNDNALQLTFASFVGLPTFDVSATAIAVYGNDPGAPKWNAIITMDISGSFTQELPQGKAAAQALLNCMHENAPTSSKLGVTLFAGCSGASCSPPLTTFQPLDAVDSGYNTLKDKIGDPNNPASGIQSCSNSSNESTQKNTPMCNTYTNQASGMLRALNQLCPNMTSCPSSTANNAIIIISDGLPQTQSCGDIARGQARCTQLENDAVTQANNAAARGVDVYTIFYADPNDPPANVNAGRDFLKTLKRGNGISLDTPDPNQLSTLMSAICAKALQHRLVW